MNDNTAAQPLDLDSLTRYEPSMCGYEMSYVEDGEYVKFSDVAALIAQARTARPAQAEARFCDGTIFKLTGWAGGAAPGGEFSTVTCERRTPDGAVEVIDYVRAARLDTTVSASIDTLTRYEPKSVYGGPVMYAETQGEWLNFEEVKQWVARQATTHPVQAGEAVDEVLSIEMIAQLIEKHTDRDFGLIVEPFARDIERTVRTTLAPVAAQQPTAWESSMYKSDRAKRVMMSAHAHCPAELSHPDKMAWMADFFLKHYTQVAAQQAAAKAPDARQSVNPAAQADALYWPHGPTEVACSSCGLTMGESRLLGELKRGTMVAASPASTPEASKQAAAVAAPSEPLGYISEDAKAMLLAGRSVTVSVTLKQYPAWPVPIYLAAPATAGAATTSEDARDAARYRWLKGHWGKRTPILNGLKPVGAVDTAFDAGIDAAMRTTQQEKK